MITSISGHWSKADVMVENTDGDSADENGKDKTLLYLVKKRLE